jgi:cbb3-type cytochrome oxidase maturation protein
MESLYMIIPVAVVFLGLGIAVFFWAVKSGQYDDLDAPAYKILMDREEHVDEKDTK